VGNRIHQFCLPMPFRFRKHKDHDLADDVKIMTCQQRLSRIDYVWTMLWGSVFWIFWIMWFSSQNTNIDVSVFIFDLRMINMSSECELHFPYISASRPSSAEVYLYMYMLSGCELIDTENISLPTQNMKFGGEWAKRTSHKLHILSSMLIFFQYQSYSHSDDMFIILKSNINTDTSIFVFWEEKFSVSINSHPDNIYIYK
jgi:hypothetical protein